MDLEFEKKRDFIIVVKPNKAQQHMESMLVRLNASLKSTKTRDKLSTTMYMQSIGLCKNETRKKIKPKKLHRIEI